MPSATARDSKVACDCQDPTGSRLRHHTGWTPKERGHSHGRPVHAIRKADRLYKHNQFHAVLWRTAVTPSITGLEFHRLARRNRSRVYCAETASAIESEHDLSKSNALIAAVANLIFCAMIGRVAIVRN